MIRSVRLLAIVPLVGLGIAGTVSAGEPAGRPGLRLAPPTPEVRTGDGTVEQAIDSALWIYGRVVSPADGASCSFAPTCSGYARRAVDRYGPLRGAVMAAERLLRDHRNLDRRYRAVRRWGKRRWHDPPEHHGFWFGHGSPRPGYAFPGPR